MAKKDQLLAELIGKDSTGYVESVHAGLVSSGLTFHDSGKTLL